MLAAGFTTPLHTWTRPDPRGHEYGYWTVYQRPLGFRVFFTDPSGDAFKILFDNEEDLLKWASHTF